MKKRSIRIFAILLAVALLCVGLPTEALPTISGDDRIQNGSFETGDTSGWTVPSWCASGVSVGSAYAKVGRYGISITGGWSNVVQVVSVNPNTDYALSFWVKGYAVVYVQTTSGAEVHTVWPENYAVWTKVTYTIPSGNNSLEQTRE